MSWCLGGSIAFAEGLDFKVLSLVPIQDGGRVKPFDTFARESVRLVTGHEHFEGLNSIGTVLDWATHPQAWEDKPFILMDNLGLKALLGVPNDQRMVAPQFLVNHEGFIAYAKSSYAKQQKKMTLDPKEKEALAVFGRLQRFEDIKSGDALALIPVADDKTQKWGTMGDLNRAYQTNKSSIPDAAMAVLEAFAGVLSSYDKQDAAKFLAESNGLSQILAQIGGDHYADVGKMRLEVLFNALKPFRWAWIIHLAAAVLIGFSFSTQSPKVSGWIFRLGFLCFEAGIGVSVYGFLLRCVIAGRPPVSNMYESLIWVTFGMTVFALAFEWIFKTRYFALAGSILAVVGFVLADNVPTVLDPSIQPIEPVLRSNFWLTIHVLTITLSYAAFLLSLGIGHVCLWSLWKHPGDKARLQTQTRLLYRVVQVGVVLLAAGTILGGVWANYSWGRFWGWDPKETWALIALLGYVAILHGRLAGWLKEKGFTIGVVCAFLGVLMAWYGVNFILGVGLHSYGFSKGGLPYVISFVVAEILLVTIVGLKTRQALVPIRT
ncbi:MAG TPA: cytochrome c biogenesis protein CcsA [bacterium]|nr:cytochrome c biogenesis protein CcsA [bacterium]